jgi:hypothetical protein
MVITVHLHQTVRLRIMQHGHILSSLPPALTAPGQDEGAQVRRTGQPRKVALATFMSWPTDGSTRDGWLTACHRPFPADHSPHRLIEIYPYTTIKQASRKPAHGTSAYILHHPHRATRLAATTCQSCRPKRPEAARLRNRQTVSRPGPSRLLRTNRPRRLLDSCRPVSCKTRGCSRC